MRQFTVPGKVLPLYAIMVCAVVYGTGEVFRDNGAYRCPQAHTVFPGLHRGGHKRPATMF